MEDTETKKISKEYLEELREIHSAGEKLIYELGINEFSQLKLKKERSYIESELEEVNKKEFNLSEKISLLYGKVSVNLETGEITTDSQKEAR